MTFKRFAEIVKENRPEITVFQHGTYAEEKTNFAVSVIFNQGQPNESRVYQYNGSYVDVLNKLHINAVEKKFIDNIKHILQELVAANGKEEEDIFGDTYIVNNDAEIANYTDLLKKYESYIIV